MSTIPYSVTLLCANAGAAAAIAMAVSATRDACFFIDPSPSLPC
ncbi:hypothetical protein [Burkholderia cenocepacia]|nr:hypothetical protein [Burkholderia cenocepacia]MDC6084704.1 hypothetical protein [Burkholderia cenocepacia]